MDTFQYDTGHRQPAASFSTGAHLDQLSAAGSMGHQQQVQSEYTTIGMPTAVSIDQQQQQQPQQMDAQMSDHQQQQPQQPQHCGICSDRATGKHYGAYSCDGCKGFFRRSVRKSHQYICRFNRNCTVDRDKRNQCRYCRLDKCFRAGMRKEAVQNERDKISFRKVSAYDDGGAGAASSISSGPLKAETQECAPPQAAAQQPGAQQQQQQQPDFSLSRIVSAEDRHQQWQLQSQQTASAAHPAGQQQVRSEASVGTICDSMQHQLLLLVEWAKSFPAFIELNVEEQVALLRAHAGELLILGVTYRSRSETAMLILGNSFRVSRSNPDVYMAQVAGRVINELVSQFRELEIDFTEYACLKAVVFFDPDAVHLPPSVSSRVRRWRHSVLQRMQDYMSGQQYRSRSRFGELLLLLPKLQSINNDMIRKVYRTKVEGLAHIDNLLQELLLGGNAETAEAVQLPMVAADGQLNSSGAAAAYEETDIMAQMDGQAAIPQPYQNGTAHDNYGVQYTAQQHDFYLNYDTQMRVGVNQAATASSHHYSSLNSTALQAPTTATAAAGSGAGSNASSATFDSRSRTFPGVSAASVYKQEH